MLQLHLLLILNKDCISVELQAPQFKTSLRLQVLQKYEFPKQMVSFDGILANFLAGVDISFHVWAET